MAETTVNESTGHRIGTNSGGELIFSGTEAVAGFAMRTSGHVAALLSVISGSTADTCLNEDALDAVQDLAWQLQQATEILAKQFERTAVAGGKPGAGCA